MQETQESLGAFLKAKREESNVSIEQVAYATRISLKMLRALEENDHTALPAPTFVRGYLQAYAKYVRMDTQDLLLRYSHHLATAPDSKKGAIKSHYLYVRERYQEKRRLVLILVLFVAMLGVAGAYFALKHKREKNKDLARQAEQFSNPAAAVPAGVVATAPGATAATPGATAATATTSTTSTTTNSSSTSASATASATSTAATTATQTQTSTSTATKAPGTVSEDSVPPNKAPEDRAPSPTSPGIHAINPSVVIPSAAPSEARTAEPALREPLAPKPLARAEEAPTAINTNEPKAQNVSLKASEDVWLRFQTDEEGVRDLTLRSGKTIVLRANKVVKIFSGNLRALSATLNGQAVTLGSDWKTKSVVLPATETANYKLPLFPQFQTKPASAAGAANSDD